MIVKFAGNNLTFPPSGGNTQSFQMSGRNNGFLAMVIVTMPNFTNTVTGTLSVLNGDGKTIYSSTGIPKGAVTVLSTTVPITHQEKYTMQLALDGDPGGSGGVATIDYYMNNA